ncbi:MAG: gliding motility-associated C-terminal domain-containing protein [Burkholderiales bacterium]|nr:gliding motility-associated C-terminal domain-containing protein [Bacteroidia bacterium]
MINCYKKVLKKNLSNLFTKNLFLRTLLIIGILFCIQGYSIAESNKLKKVRAVTLTVSLIKTDNPCEGRSVGTITTTVTGGVAPYKYVWNDAVTSQNRLKLPRGTYTVDVTDVLGDTGTATITIVDPAPIIINGAGIDDVKCALQTNGNAFITVSGGTPPYTYRWTLKGVLVSTNKDLLNQGAGVYTIVVKDNNPAGCNANTQYTIIEPASILVTESSHIDNVEFGESNGAITLKVTGGIQGVLPAPLYTYLWSDGVTTKDRTGLQSGLYSVMVTDANNCTKPFSTKILPLSAFNVSGITADNKCFGTPNGSITITATGGVPPYKYSWSDIGTVINPDRSNLSAGTYKLASIDANGLGATRTNTFTITEPTLLTMGATKTDNVCFSPPYTATINLTASGGMPPYSYILDANAPVSFASNNIILTSISPGNHTVKIIDANLCATPPQTFSILPTAPLVPLFTMTQVGCSTLGQLATTVTGGLPPYNFSWSNGGTTPILPNLAVGSYTLTLTDALGCVVTSTQTVAQSASPLIITENTGAHLNNNCFDDLNGNITVIVTGGLSPYNYSWSNGANTPSISNLASGNYTVTVTDAVSCVSSLTVSILPTSQISAGEIISNVTCLGTTDGSITLSPTGGTSPLSVFWLADGSTVNTKTGLIDGIYQVRITDANTCFKVFDITVLPAIPLTQLDTLIQKSDVCKGQLPNGSIKLTVEGGKPPYSFKWSVADPLTGNIITDLPLISRDPLLSVNEDLINQLPQGFYVVTVTDANGCITFLPSVDPLVPLVKTYEVLPVSCTLANDKLKIDPLMSPNDDGQGNNFFNINNIENFPDNEVIIYNRWGMEVFTIKRYNNQDRVFRGVANSALTNKNEVLVDGVYYYTVRTVQDNISRINKGYVIMKR